MALRNIVRSGDEILTKVCRPVEKFNERLWTVLDDMAETMHNADGVGLAAPQVGLLRRIVVIDVGDGVVELINPEIVRSSGVQEGTEGCLSFPGEWGEVTRPKYVTVRAQDRTGKTFELEGEDLMARAVFHEVDHLNGVCFPQRASRMLTPEEVRELQRAQNEE